MSAHRIHLLKPFLRILALFLLLLAVLSACTKESKPNGSVSTEETTDSQPLGTSTSETEHEHLFSEWQKTSTFTCLGEEIHIRTCTTCDATEESYQEVHIQNETVSLDGKTVAFIGNSFIYYGNCVINGGQGSTDKGYFYQIARENGESVTVLDYVYGGRNLEYIYNNVLRSLPSASFSEVDYVFFSEAGENNASIISDLKNIMALFPQKTQFLYLCHSYTYQKNHGNIKNALSSMQNLGISVVNWGELVYDVWTGATKVPGATLSYNKETFVKNNSGVKNGSGSVVGSGSSGDSHHPNPLSGYLTALMTYTAVTGKSAVGQPYAFCDNPSLHAYFNLDAFRAAHYNGSKSTNFTNVFRSTADMKGLQTLIDRYNETYHAFTGIITKTGPHRFGEEGELLHPGSSNTDAWRLRTCQHCGTKETVSVPEGDPNRYNQFLIPQEEVLGAGYKTVKDYMLSGKSKIAYQATSGWGRIGYASIQGMASLCDGNRSSAPMTDGSVLYWKIKSRSNRYHADGSSGGSYCALIGYELKEAITASGLSLFVLDGGALQSYDVLGGIRNGDGSITWTVLASCRGTDAEYIPYDGTTKVFSASFDPTRFDCLEIGIISASSDILYLSELEIYGATP